jgi:hypothetical protein
MAICQTYHQPKNEHNGGQFFFELHKITPKTEQQIAANSARDLPKYQATVFFIVRSVLDLWMHNGSLLSVRLSAWPWPNGVLGGRPLNGVGCLYHDGAIALLLLFYLRGVHEKVFEFAFYGRSGSLARSPAAALFPPFCLPSVIFATQPTRTAIFFQGLSSV